jgi:agmatinase
MSEKRSEAGAAPLDGRIFPRFAGLRTFMRVKHADDVAGADLAVIGIPFDGATSFRSGARFGPAAIREASILLRPYHPGHGVDLFDHLTVVDHGDLPVIPSNVERTYDELTKALAPIVAAGVYPLVLGGDHSITLAELRALAAQHGPLGLVQFDAHSDTWDEYFGERYFHGTTFRRAVEEGLLRPGCVFQAGLRGSLYGADDLTAIDELGLTALTAPELRALEPAAFGSLVKERLGNTPTFLSFDIDFVDPAFAPGTGTPEIAGFTSVEAIDLVRALSGLNLVGSDIVEVSPPYDTGGHTTALVAANVAWEMVALAAVAARDRIPLTT